MRVLVIGCGSIGSRRARLLAEMPGVEVGLCDADMIRAANVFDECAGIVGRSRSAPLDRSPWMHTDRVEYALMREPDAAIICTPPESHVDVAMQCLRAGVPVFVEKPLALSMDGVQALVEAARGTASMAACNMRWAYRMTHGPDRRWRSIRAVTAHPLSAWRPGAAAAYRAHGIVLEAAWHDLDLVHAIAGPFRSIRATGDADMATIRIEHESGAASTVHAVWGESAKPRRSLSLAGRVASQHIEPDTSDTMYRREMAHFLECVRAGETPCNPLADAAHVLAWALEADRQRKAVTV